MNNTIFYLIGTTAAARLAVAQEIGALTGARIVDSQALYVPIFNVVEQRSPAEMPEGVWKQVDAVRAAVLTTIETLSPGTWDFAFTHAGLPIPADVGVYRTVRDMAKRRGSQFLPVTLASDPPKQLLRFDEGNALTIDAADRLPAKEAAARIVAAANASRA